MNSRTSVLPKPKGRYSKMEQRLLALLLLGGRIDTNALVLGAYKKQPFNARASVMATMRSLIRKVKFQHEAFVIKETERRGPHPKEFWMEVKRK